MAYTATCPYTALPPLVACVADGVRVTSVHKSANETGLLKVIDDVDRSQLLRINENMNNTVEIVGSNVQYAGQVLQALAQQRKLGGAIHSGNVIGFPMW